jgi:hypothetical protein
MSHHESRPLDQEPSLLPAPVFAPLKSSLKTCPSVKQGLF